MPQAINRRAALKAAGAAILAAPFARAAEARFLVNGHPASADAGMKILREGGNAVDAMVAAALVAAVTSPNNCGIGGYGGHMIIAMRGKAPVAIDFNSTAPAAAKPGMFAPDAQGAVPGRINEVGWLAAGVPGTLAGLQLALDRYGTKPLRGLLAPAIRFASEGFAIPEGMASAIRGRAAFLRKNPGSAALLLKDGEPLTAGEVYRNRDLAKMLEQFADENSVASFYGGEIGRKIAAAFQMHGGLVTAADMAAYRAREIEPYRFDWREFNVYTAPLTAGGLSVIQALSILKPLEWPKNFDDPESSHALVESLRIAWADRLALLGDPEKSNIPVARILSTDSAEKSANRVRSAVKAKRALDLSAPSREHSGTIHLNGADANGNMVSLTLTHGDSFGACVTVAGLGLTLGHGMSRFHPAPGHPNSPGPGKRPLHNMCPTVVYRGERAVAVLGGRGGRAIPNAVFHVLTNLVGRGSSLAEAIRAPRFNTQGGLDLTLERAWPAADAEAFGRLGFAVKTGASATIHGISFDPKNGLCEGAGR